MMVRLWSVTIAICCGVSVTLPLGAAQLVFDQPQVVLELPIDKQEADVVFPFRNTSGSAVRILEVRTDCDCIQTSMGSRDIAAGQAGEVVIKFRSKLRNGTDVVRARVVADNNEIHEISVNAKLRSYIEVRPLALHWKKGGKREAKQFTVSATGLGKVYFSKVVAVKDSKVEIYRDEKNPAFIRVNVSPPAGDDPFQDVLLVSAGVGEINETKVYDLPIRGE